MILNVHISEQVFPIEVPESLVSEAAGFFDKMDSDLDRGYQMSRTWDDGRLHREPPAQCQRRLHQHRGQHARARIRDPWLNCSPSLRHWPCVMPTVRAG